MRGGHNAETQPALPWWRSAVIYQVYIRSFADGNGDGVGDIAGLRSRLRYIADLGADALWINPWYPSPMKDAGYDVSDFRDIEPTFGTLSDAEAMIGEAHALGLRVLLDIVPNHVSDQHALFQEAVGAGPGSRERERFIFREGRGPRGEERPNDWSSGFGGPAWTRVTEADGRPDSGTYTCSAPGSRTSTGALQRCGRSSRRQYASGLDAESMGFGSTWPMVSSRPMASPTSALRSGHRPPRTRVRVHRQCRAGVSPMAGRSLVFAKPAPRCLHDAANSRSILKSPANLAALLDPRTRSYSDGDARHLRYFSFGSAALGSGS